MKFIELFAGIGGFRLGLETIWNSTNNQVPIRRSQHSFNCVWANEIDKYACQIYRRRFGATHDLSATKECQHPKTDCACKRERGVELERSTRLGNIGGWDEASKLYEGDIRGVATESIPDHDLLVGGFPCQAFSIAGKRGGFDDTRGTLFFEIARILRDKRPRCVLLENVRGLLSHDSGKTFQVILKVLSDIGYRVEWQILNSKDFGVPQNRERVFIVGYLRGTGRGKVFPLTNSGGQGINQLNHPKHSNDRIYGIDGLSPTINTMQGGRRQPFISLSLQGINVRRLTPVEAERLQGFPDGWTEGISDTQRYKCLGNAVTVNVIRAIGERL